MSFKVAISMRFKWLDDTVVCFLLSALVSGTIDTLHVVAFSAHDDTLAILFLKLPIKLLSS
jgi:hypothetical protein